MSLEMSLQTPSFEAFMKRKLRDTAGEAASGKAADVTVKKAGSSQPNVLERQAAVATMQFNNSRRSHIQKLTRGG